MTPAEPEIQPALPVDPSPAGEFWQLRLVIAGTTRRSNAAVANLKQICEKYLPAGYELEIIDIYQQPELAAELQVVAAPMLIKQSPLPAQRLVGDLSQVDRVLHALGLPPETKEAPPA